MVGTSADGSLIPSILRIVGKLGVTEASSNVQKLVVFYNKLEPFSLGD